MSYTDLIYNRTTCVKILCPQHTRMLICWLLRHARRHQSMDASATRC